VVHLGDMVAKSSGAQFRYFAELVAPLTERGIPILPVLGNHEYFGAGRDPTFAARRRFPELAASRFYAARFGRLGLVLLDSNLTGRAAERQLAFVERTVAAFDADARVHGVLFFTHHPPFTNGVHRAGEPSVEHEIFPRFVASAKARVFFSGHVHGYERFTLAGRTLVVSGGGGGARVHYRVGAQQSLPPAEGSPSGAAKRPLNYVIVRDTGRELVLVARCLGSDPACRDGTLDEARIPLP